MTKAIFRQMVAESGQPMKAVAAAMPMPYWQFAHKLNDQKRDRFSPEEVKTLTRVTGSKLAICDFAYDCDLAVIALPSRTTTHDDIRDRFLRAVEELGQDSAAIQRALADGEITASEGRDVAAELRDTIEALLEVEAAVLMKAQKPSPARMTLPTPAPIERRA